jgi:hypothetical protein
MKPISLVYLDHTQDDLDEDGPETLPEIASRMRRHRPSLGDGMSLQSDTPEGMLRWLQSSMA